MTSIRIPLLTLALVSLAAGCAGPLLGSGDCCASRAPANTFRSGMGRPIGVAPGVIVVDAVPPARLYEPVPARPYSDALWLPGYWDWDGAAWIWIPGHWETAPLGYAWIGPSYDYYGSYCEYTPGYWQRSNDPGATNPRASNPRRGNRAVDYPRSDTVTSARRPTPPTVQIQTPRSPPSVTVTPSPRPTGRLKPVPARVPARTPEIVRVKPSPRTTRPFTQPKVPGLRPARRSNLTPKYTAPRLPPVTRSPPAVRPSRIAPRSFAPARRSTPSFKPSFKPAPPPASRPTVQVPQRRSTSSAKSIHRPIKSTAKK